MGLGETVLAVGAGERPASFEQFSAAIDPAWIAAALAATGTASVRRRKLPAEHVVWLVIGMGLFHDRSIAQVVQHLDLVLPTRHGGRGHVTNAAIVQARDQAGAKPLAALADPARQRHWLVRAKTGRTALKVQVVQRLGPGDHVLDLTPSHGTRTAHRTLPATLRVRAVRVHHRGFRPYLVFTSLLDPIAYPAAELVALYHERWELELTFDEVKTHTLERAEALRSQAPTRVEQEVWGLLLAYNLLRLVMSRAAPRAAVPPLRLSYRHALLALRGFWHTAWLSPPGVLPRRLEALLDELALFVLPERRPRRYPRAVKIKMSNYPRKRPRRRRIRVK